MSTQVSTEVKMKSRYKKPKIFKNRIVVFCIWLFLFALSFFALLLIDQNNVFRPKFLNVPFFLNLLDNLGIGNVDITAFIWLVFFLFFGIGLVIFFLLFVHDYALGRYENHIKIKQFRDMDNKDIKKFNILFYVISFSVMALGIAAVLLIFRFAKGINFFEVISQQLSNKDLWNTQFLPMLKCLGFLICSVLILPVTLAILIILILLVIKIIALIVGGVSNSVMQSESYQEHKAASMAAADDISRKMQEAESLAGDSVRKANAAKDFNGGAPKAPEAECLFPALTKIDLAWEEKQKAIEEKKNAEIAEIEEYNKHLKKGEEPKVYVEHIEEVKPFTYDDFRVFAFEFQSYLCSLKFYFDINVIRSFIAGLSAARLILLEGLSGTGKSTLPRVFLDYVGGEAYFFPVQATWRDRSDITGYYSDFTGQFKETELLKHLYEASYTPDVLNLMVLDEMNISRVEYYFADFLSIFEYPSSNWVVPLMQVRPTDVMPRYIENGKVRIPVNTWFVGTVNIDDSTFTITDKVYDRAIVIDFKELNMPFESSYSSEVHPLHISQLTNMFEECKSKPENNLTGTDRVKFMKLVEFMGSTFDIQFGNRIMNQIDNFLPVFVGLGGTKEEAIDIMFARKILRKLDGKFESYIKDGLNKLTRFINTSYGKGKLKETEASIERYRRKLS